MSKTADREGEARAWLGRLYGAEPDAQTLGEFRSWVAASPDNARAYRQLEQLWRDLPAVEGFDRSPISRARELKARPIRRFQMLGAGVLAGGGIAAALAVAVLVFQPFDQGLEHTFATAVGETRTIRLSDGTEIVLGPKTTLAVRVTRRARSVAMQSGEAFFSVAHDPKRPLTVASAGTEVRVLGTRFDVRRGPGAIDVAVVDGRVEVADRPDPGASSRTDEATVILIRGQQVSAALDGKLGPPRQVNPDRITDWRSGRLRYVDTALRDVLADINRYSATPITYRDDSIGLIRITASFSVGEARSILESIAASNDLVLQPDGAGLVVERR